MTAGEMANGNISLRPWLMTIDEKEIETVVVTAIVNGPYLVGRAEMLGTNSSPVRGALACAMMTALFRLPLDRVWALVEDAWTRIDGEPPPAETRQQGIQLIADRMAQELSDFCPSGCKRIESGDRLIDERKSFNWWKRFSLPDDENLRSRETTGVGTTNRYETE